MRLKRVWLPLVAAERRGSEAYMVNHVRIHQLLATLGSGEAGTAHEIPTQGTEWADAPLLIKLLAAESTEPASKRKLLTE